MIRSRNNPQVRALRRLRNAHTRRQTDLLLLEGPHLVDAAAEAGLAFRHLLATPGFRAARIEMIRRLEHRSGIAAALIDADRLREQADADAPQGLAALVEPPAGWHSAEGETLVLPSGLHLYVDGVQDPGNLGAMARSAEAAGAASLLLAPGTARPSQPRALRASAGSLLRIPVRTDVQLDQAASGVSTLALTSGKSPGTDVPLPASSPPAVPFRRSWNWPRRRPQLSLWATRAEVFRRQFSNGPTSCFKSRWPRRSNPSTRRLQPPWPCSNFKGCAGSRVTPRPDPPRTGAALEVRSVVAVALVRESRLDSTLPGPAPPLRSAALWPWPWCGSHAST